MSEQQAGGNVGIPRPTRFVAVIGDALNSYPGHGGPGIQLSAWVANAIIAYLNAPAGENGGSAGNGGAGGSVDAVRLTNLAQAVQQGIDKWEAGHEEFGPSEANYIADAVIGWLQNTY